MQAPSHESNLCPSLHNQHLKRLDSFGCQEMYGLLVPVTSMGFIVMSALTAVTQVVAPQSNILFLTQAHGVANLSILLSLRVTIAQSVVGVPNMMGTWCANLAELQAMSAT